MRGFDGKGRGTAWVPLLGLALLVGATSARSAPGAKEKGRSASEGTRIVLDGRSGEHLIEEVDELPEDPIPGVAKLRRSPASTGGFHPLEAIRYRKWRRERSRGKRGALGGGFMTGARFGRSRASEAFAGHKENTRRLSSAGTDSKLLLDFHVARCGVDDLRVDGELVDGDWATRELPVAGREPEDPLRLVTGEHPATLHLRGTGWIRLAPGSELLCHAEGKALRGRLEAGGLVYRRVGTPPGLAASLPFRELRLVLRPVSTDALEVRDGEHGAGAGRVHATLDRARGVAEVLVADGSFRVFSR